MKNTSKIFQNICILTALGCISLAAGRDKQEGRVDAVAGLQCILTQLALAHPNEVLKMAKTARNIVPKEEVVEAARGIVLKQVENLFKLEKNYLVESRQHYYLCVPLLPFPIIEEEPREGEDHRISRNALDRNIRYTFSEFIRYFTVFTESIDDGTIRIDNTMQRNVIVDHDKMNDKNKIDGVNYHCLYILLCRNLRDGAYYIQRLRSAVEDYKAAQAQLAALTDHQDIAITEVSAKATTGGASSSSGSVN